MLESGNIFVKTMWVSDRRLDLGPVNTFENYTYFCLNHGADHEVKRPMHWAWRSKTCGRTSDVSG